MLSLFFFIDRLCRSLSIFRPGQDAKLIVFFSKLIKKNIKKKNKKKRINNVIIVLNFDKVGSNGLGAFGSCPIPDVNFLFILFFFNRPKGRQ